MTVKPVFGSAAIMASGTIIPAAELPPEPVEAWEAPVSLDTEALPKIPQGLMPGWLGRFTEAVAWAVQVPLELPALMALSVVGTCVAKRLEIKPVQGNYSEPLNTWVLAPLEPGNRKSAVMEACAAPLLAWEKAEVERLAPAITELTTKRSVIEGRIKALEAQAHKAEASELPALLEAIKAERQELPIIPSYPTLWTEDITPEKLAALMGENGERMGLLSAEGGIFDIIAGRYSKGEPNLDIFLKGHSGDAVRVHRGSREPVHLAKPALSMGISPQPEVLTGLADKPGFRGRGLLGRFLYAIPESLVGYRSTEPRSIDEAAARDYADGIARLLSIQPALNADGAEEPGILYLSAEALQEWTDFAGMVEAEMRPGGKFEHAKDWAGKLPGAMLRVAGLFHVVTHSHENPANALVSLETMGKALHLGGILSQHALKAFGEMGANPSLADAKHVWRWIERNGKRVFKSRDAFDGLKGRFKTMGELEPALLILKERHYIRELIPTERKPGRPKRDFEVNPALAEGWT